ncbi:DUF5691 domain-containing protein [soil metagenome]
MNAWNQITSAALLGVGRLTPELKLPAPLDELLADSEGEARMLRACGILAVVGMAARIYPKADESGPEPAADEVDRVPCPPKIAGLARRLLDEGHTRLVAEMCVLLAKGSYGLPPRLLPAALELGRKTVALRGPLRGVLGQRGAWLAAQNPSWSFAVLAGREAADRRLWDEGDATQRAAYLALLRQTDTTGARELLEGTFSQETARDRAILLPAIGEKLAPDDEAFLAKVLAEDRGKEVRQIAAALLSRLPASGLACGITESLEPCTRTERKLFRTQIVIEPPAAFDPRWKANTIEEKPPASLKLGERAFWLLQLASLAPLSWWQSRLGGNPAEILALAAKSEWKDALLGGFRTAIANQPGFPEWTVAFLETGGVPLDEAMALALKLPPTEADRAFQRIIASLNEAGLAVRAIEVAEFPWSAELWRAARQKLPQWLGQQDWRMRTALTQMACRIPAALLQEEQKWPDAPFFADAIAEFSRIIDQRRTLHQHLKP